jgi:hypothetical protein
MNTKHLILVPAVLAGLVAGCGGGTQSADSGERLSGKFLASSVTSSALSGPTVWKSVKIGGGGYIPGLIFHPTSPNVLYARTDIGGAYRWDQATSSWLSITDGFGTDEGFFHGAESIALDPNDDQRVFMTTGMYTWGGNGRLYISSDRGDHWQHVDLPFPVGTNNQGRAIGERLMVDPNQPSILLYGSRTAGLWKSADAGQSWQQVPSLSSFQMTGDQINAANGGSPVGVEQVVYDTSTKGKGSATQTIYTAVAPDYAGLAGLTFNLYKSTDGGATWSGIPTPVTGAHIPHMVRAADGVFYIVFTHSSGPGADGPASLYKFDGANWTLLNSTTPTQWTSFGYGGLSVYGSGPATRIALGITNSWGNWQGQPVVALSDDAGKTWREIASSTPHTPADGGFSGWIDDVEIDPSNPDHILHVTGGGVWSTSNASAAAPSWNFTVNGIEETANVTMMSAPPGAPYKLLNSSMDVGMLLHTDLNQSPVLGPQGSVGFDTGYSADAAWSAPSYLVAIGAPHWGSSVAASYSTDSGKTWSAFQTNHPDALANATGESNIAVTRKYNAVWAPGNSVPYYTTDNGATWLPTNLPAIARMSVNRSYRVVADRRNPNKVYAYDSGGAWWGTPGKFYRSVDGGHSFTVCTDPTVSSLRANNYQSTSLAVNPYAEGDVWLADGLDLYHSVDSGATWKKLDVTESDWGDHADWSSWFHPEVYGASVVALGKAAPGARYSAAVYMVGRMKGVGAAKGVWGVYRSDDAGATWLRVNDDQHQFGGIGTMAADQNVYGRFYVSGGGRGILSGN